MNTLKTYTAAGLAAAGLLVATAAPAHADVTVGDYIELKGPYVCTFLERFPSGDNLVKLANAIADEGWDAETAGLIVVGSVNEFCPSLRAQVLAATYS